MKPFLLPRLKARRNAIRLGSLVLKLVLFMPLPAFCQSLAVSSVNIPFAFSANGKTLPAGDYLLYRDSENIYSLRTPSGVLARRMVVYPDSAANIQDTSKLVFHTDGQSYSLDSFWRSGSREGMRVLNSSRKKEENTAHGNVTDTVMVASTSTIAIQK